MSEQTTHILIGIGIAVLVVGGLVVGWYLEKKRREALRKWSAANGWTFEAGKRYGSPSFPIDVFHKGHSRYRRYRMERPFDDATPGLGGGPARVEVFEYHYAITSGSGKNRRTTHYYYTVLHASAGMLLGEVEMREEHFGDRIAAAVGFDDIDFEDPVFSKKWLVKARDRADAYALIGPEMMRYLSAKGGWAVETFGTSLVVIDRGKLTPERAAGAAAFAMGMLEQLPRTLVNQGRAARGEGPELEAGAASGRSKESLARLGV